MAVLDINGDKAEEAAKAIGSMAFAVACDVGKGKSVDAAVADVIARVGRLDIVVNNAGISHRNQPMLDVTEEEFDRVFDVNVKSIYLMAKATVPHFREHGGGVILNIGSTAGLRPRPGPDLVQRLQGRGEPAVEIDGGRTRAGPHPRQRDRAGRRRDAAARHLHGRGHAGEAQGLHRVDSLGPVLDAAGHRQRRAVPVLATSRRW